MVLIEAGRFFGPSCSAAIWWSLRLCFHLLSFYILFCVPSNTIL